LITAKWVFNKNAFRINKRERNNSGRKWSAISNNGRDWRGISTSACASGGKIMSEADWSEIVISEKGWNGISTNGND
jgi:hypothetical protein